MFEKDKALYAIWEVEELLKQRDRESRTKGEQDEINKRGENRVDFYRISFKLQRLERMRQWVYTYAKLTRSQKEILKEYRRI